MHDVKSYQFNPDIGLKNLIKELKQEEKMMWHTEVNYRPSPISSHDFPKPLCVRIKTLFVLGSASCRLSFDLPALHTRLSVAYSLMVNFAPNAKHILLTAC